MGIYLGPAVGGKNWEAPMNKFIERVEEIAETRAPLEYACALFKSKALSVLGYVAQICIPPKALKVTELRVANKILRLATNSFTTNCVYQLDTFHCPKLERPVVFLLPSLLYPYFSICIMHIYLSVGSRAPPGPFARRTPRLLQTSALVASPLQMRI